MVRSLLKEIDLIYFNPELKMYDKCVVCCFWISVLLLSSKTT